MKLPWNILINMVDISGEMQERNKNVFKLVIIQMFFGFLCISRVGFNN